MSLYSFKSSLFSVKVLLNIAYRLTYFNSSLVVSSSSKFLDFAVIHANSIYK